MKIQSNNCFSNHTMLLKENGDLYSFGYNGYGQCGVGNQNDVNRPTKIMNNKNIRSIYLGVWNSFFIENNGDLYGCGYNYKGELSVGNFENTNKFTFITKGVKKICASRYFTLIQKYDGKIYYSGEISNISQKVFTLIEIEDVVDFCCGEYHCLFLKKNGEIYGMGLNRKGELLGNELKEYNKPTLLLTEKDCVAISCTLYQNFILTKQGDVTTLKTFGKENDFYGCDTEKEKIFIIKEHTDIQSIHCGSDCCFILKKNGDVFASGHNLDGQLSLGTTCSSFGFKKTNLANITHIVAGYHNTIFIDDKKQIYNCGNGGSGKLGINFDGNRNIASLFNFEELILVNNYEFVDEWSPDIHKNLPLNFQKLVFSFLICLKKRNGAKVPKPISKIIIKYIYSFSNC